MHCNCNASVIYLILVMEMAEFCLACWNDWNKKNDPPEMFILSKEPDICEGCGQWKPVIVAVRKGCILRKKLRCWAKSTKTQLPKD